MPARQLNLLKAWKHLSSGSQLWFPYGAPQDGSAHSILHRSNILSAKHNGCSPSSSNVNCLVLLRVPTADSCIAAAQQCLEQLQYLYAQEMCESDVELSDQL